VPHVTAVDSRERFICLLTRGCEGSGPTRKLLYQRAVYAVRSFYFNSVTDRFDSIRFWKYRGAFSTPKRLWKSTYSVSISSEHLSPVCNSGPCTSVSINQQDRRRGSLLNFYTRTRRRGDHLNKGSPAKDADFLLFHRQRSGRNHLVRHAADGCRWLLMGTSIVRAAARNLLQRTRS